MSGDKAGIFVNKIKKRGVNRKIWEKNYVFL